MKGTKYKIYDRKKAMGEEGFEMSCDKKLNKTQGMPTTRANSKRRHTLHFFNKQGGRNSLYIFFIWVFSNQL